MKLNNTEVYHEKAICILSMPCIVHWHAMAAAVEPIGALGGTGLGQARFLPDGTVLGVVRNGIAIIDPGTDNVIVHFAEDSGGIRHLECES